MTKPRRLTRRNALQMAAATTALPLVHIRTAGAAGKLSIAFWDHWVPAGDACLLKQCQAWGEKNMVEVKVDFITSVGFKLLLTAATEAQAGSGHDAMQFGQNQYDVHTYAEKLEPVEIGRASCRERVSPYV